MQIDPDLIFIKDFSKVVYNKFVDDFNMLPLEV